MSSSIEKVSKKGMDFMELVRDEIVNTFIGNN